MCDSMAASGAVLYCVLSVPGHAPCEPSQAMAETYYRAPVVSFAAVLHSVGITV